MPGVSRFLVKLVARLVGDEVRHYTVSLYGGGAETGKFRMIPENKTSSQLTYFQHLEDLRE